MPPTIVFLLLGHTYQPLFLFYPSYYFQFPLLLFVAGYFIDIKVDLKQKIIAFFNDFKKTLFLYFLVNLFFLLVYFFFKYFGAETGREIGFYNFFIEPFVSSHQFWLISGAWLIPCLFVSRFILQFLIWNNSKPILIALLILFGALMFLILDSKENENGLKLFISKVTSCCFYLMLGHNFKINEFYLKNKITNASVILFCIVAVEQLRVVFGDLTISFPEGKINNLNTFAPIFSSIMIIIITYNFCTIIVSATNKKVFLEKITQHSSLILLFHLFSFFIFNFILLLLGKIYLGDFLNVTFRYQMQNFWLFYLGIGLILPISFSSFIIKRYPKICNHLNFDLLK